MTNKNTKRKIRTYRGFKQKLISLLVSWDMYDRDDATQKVHNDEFKDYYDDKYTAYETMSMENSYGI